MLRNILFLLLVSSRVPTVILAQDECNAEFEKCVMNRDCCPKLSCVAGDWAVTTDSHCLSERSAELNALSKDDKLAMLKDFYDNKAPPQNRRSTAEVFALYEKNSRMFAKLVMKIEKKYEVKLVVPGAKKKADTEL